jgi:hypothetical protein
MDGHDVSLLNEDQQIGGSTFGMDNADRQNRPVRGARRNSKRKDPLPTIVAVR